MKKTQLKNTLLDELAILLKPYDFVLVRRMDWFIRKGTPSLIYQLAFYDGYSKNKGYTIAPALAVRIEEVEKIFHKVSGFEPKYQKDTPTINPTIKDLVKAKDDYEFELAYIQDVNPLVNKLFKIFKNIALPFLEENSSIVAIDKLLNSNPENEDSIFYIPYLRFYHGAIVAKLSCSPNYQYITETYRRYLTRETGFYLKDYEKLLAILKDVKPGNQVLNVSTKGGE